MSRLLPVIRSFVLFICVSVLFVSTPILAAQSSPDRSIVASVNGVPITRSDLDRAVRYASKYGKSVHVTEDFKNAVLDEMINMILIEDYLSERKELGNPELEDELKFARQKALKNYFLAQQAGKPQSVSLEKINQFVKEHPDFFMDRKTYHYADVKFEKEPRLDVSRVKAMILMANKNAKSADSGTPQVTLLNPVLGYLGAVNVVFVQYRGFRSSEQIDERILEDLKALQPNEAMVDDQSDKSSIHVVALFSVQPDPMDPAQARSQIAQGMVAKEVSGRVEAIISQLRDNAVVKKGIEASSSNNSARTTLAPIRQRLVEPTTGNVLILDYVKAFWIFSLIILLPVSLMDFHRKTLQKRQEAVFFDANVTSMIRNRLTLATFHPVFEIILLLFVFPYFAYTSLVLFSQAPKNSLSLAGLFVASIAISFLFVLIVRKYSRLFPKFISNSRLLPLGLLVLVQTAFLFW